MKNLKLEDIIYNVRILLRNKVPIPVILFALKGDGVPEKHRETIIRWAQMWIKNTKLLNLNTVIDVKEL